MSDKTYQAKTTTPEQDRVLDELRASLVEWLLKTNEKGIDHSIVLTALMLFTASGVAATEIPKEAFLDMMSRYYDIYRTTLKAQS